MIIDYCHLRLVQKQILVAVTRLLPGRMSDVLQLALLAASGVKNRTRHRISLLLDVM